MANNIDIVFRGNLRISTAQAKEDIAAIQEDINKMSSTPFGKGIATQLQRELDQRKTAIAASVAAPIVQGVKTAANQIPPILKQAVTKSNQQSGDMWKNIIAGALVGGTNPFMGAKFMMQAFKGGAGGGGGGGIGGIFGGLFSGAGGGNLAAAVLWRAFRLASDAAEMVRKAFEQLVHAAQEASKLYQISARLGRSPGRQGVLQEALGAIGIDPGQAQLLQLYGEFPTRRGRGGRGGGQISASGEILAAGRGVLQQGELQQIKNLSKYLDDFVRSAGVFNKVMQDNSRQLFNTTFVFSKLKADWKALWTELAGDISVLILPELMALHNAFTGFFAVMKLIPGLAIFDFFKAKFEGFEKFFGSSVLKGLPVNQFQRLGFAVGPTFGSQNPQLGVLNQQLKTLDKIEQNTNPNKASGRQRGVVGGFNSDVGLDAFIKKFFSGNNSPG